MKKTIIIIICIIISILLFVVGPILGVYFFFNYPKIKEINIKEDEIQLYKGNTYSIAYKISPKNAKKVNIISISDKEYVTIEDNKITAKKVGKTKICYMQKNNKKINDCITINIISKRDKLIADLDRMCNKIDEGIYNCFNAITNLNNYTYKLISSDGDTTYEYTYYFSQNYISGYANSGGAKVEYFYKTDTRTLSCLGNPPIFHNAACSYSSQQITINLFDTMVQAVDTLLNDLTLEDLKN